MAKLPPNEAQQRAKLVRAIICANQERYDVTDKQLAKLLNVRPETIGRKKNRPGGFDLNEIQIIAPVLHFSPMQAASLLLGREVKISEF